MEKGARGTRRRGINRFRQLNPAFAAAHGLEPISTDSVVETEGGTTPVKSPDSKKREENFRRLSEKFKSLTPLKDRPLKDRPLKDRPLTPQQQQLAQEEKRQESSRGLEYAIKAARSTGRLNLSNHSGLTLPLPDCVFDLGRSHRAATVTIDLSVGRDDEDLEKHDETTLLSLDISDNDLGPANGESSKDDRLSRFLKLQVFRARRCNFYALPFPGDVFLQLEYLAVVDLRGNQLDDLASLISLFPPSLRELDLSANQLVHPHKNSGHSNHVEIELPNLTSVDLSENKLSSLPLRLSCPRLKTLRSSNNELSQLPPTLFQSQETLQTLELSSNRLRYDALPDFSKFPKLQVLDLSSNALTRSPHIHPNLVRLSITNNSVSGSLAGMVSAGNDQSVKSNLTDLLIRNNKLKSLDASEMTTLVKLTLLDVGENELCNPLPAVLGYLPHLRKILVDRNPLRMYRNSALQNTEQLKSVLRSRGPPPPSDTAGEFLEAEVIFEEEVVASRDRSGVAARANVQYGLTPRLTEYLLGESMALSTLDFSNRKLTELPTTLVQDLQRIHNDDSESLTPIGSHLRSWNVSNNQLSQLLEGDWFTVMPHLKSLDLSSNRLQSPSFVPETIVDVPLKTISLRRNILTSDALASSCILRHATTSQLSKTLTELNLSSNSMDSIPDAIFDLSQLILLNVAQNRISSIAGWRLGSLPHLRHLDVSENQLSEVPLSAIASWAHPSSTLRVLNLQYNNLRLIPPSLGVIETLESLDVRGNPQRAIRPAVLDRGCDALLAYLRDRMTRPQVEEVERWRQQLIVEQPALSDADRGAQKNPQDETLMANAEATETETMQAEKERSEPRELPTVKHEEPTPRMENDALPKVAPPATAATREVQQPSEESSELLNDLRAEIDKLSEELNSFSITESKKYALKKKLAMQRAKLLREERRLKSKS